MNRSLVIAVLALVLTATGQAEDRRPDASRDILVTLANEGARNVSTGVNAPYRKRKRYPVEADTLLAASQIAEEYELAEVDRWPIRSLSVLCIVYRVDRGRDRDSVIERLEEDARVESAQRLQEFETLAQAAPAYDDTYTGLQRALVLMDVPAAHRYSRGRGVRVAIVDGRADTEHEDLDGRVGKVSLHIDAADPQDAGHGTAVASVIAATANNAKGIVGVAPEAIVEVHVACRGENGAESALCDSFTLARAFDEIVGSRPDVVNLSLVGPYDKLLADLLEEVDRVGTVVVAARAADNRENRAFPASLPRVIGVASSDGSAESGALPAVGNSVPPPGVFAPGRQIMVAVPPNNYDFRSGSSLAAAHVSGVVALLLFAAPDLSADAVRAHLQSSQRTSSGGWPAVNACTALQRVDGSLTCP